MTVKGDGAGGRVSLTLSMILSEMYAYLVYISLMTNQAKTKRVHARIAPDALETVKRAAELHGRSVSDFMVAAAQEAAYRAIEKAQIIRLSVEDQRAFAEAILNSPAPNDALRRAAEAYKGLVKANW